MALFLDSFWGERHNGFELLMTNLKSGEQSCKDFEDLIKQCHALEDTYVKAVGKIVKNVGSYSTSGSFGPVWELVKGYFEKLSSTHQDLSKKLQELVKDVHKYYELTTKKYKAIKDGQSGTHETVQSMQTTSNHLTKSKEVYATRFNDYKKVLTDKAAMKKIEKAEQEFKRATDDYKTCVAKYNTTAEDYEKKMRVSVDLFQETELEFLSQMETFVNNFSTLREESHTEIGEIHYNFHSGYSDMSVETLLEKFVEAKSTGMNPPAAAEFVEADISSLPAPPSPPDDNANGENVARQTDAGTPTTSTSMMHLDIKKIFKRRNKPKVDKDNDSNRDGDSVGKTSNNSQPEVDEEGYTIRKDRSLKEEYSSDTSDSEDNDKPPPKIKVNIRPLDANGSSTGSTPITSPRLQEQVRSQSADLLDLFAPSPTSSAAAINTAGSTPVWGNTKENSFSAEDNEVHNSWKSNSVSASSLSSSQSVVIPGLPRPPSRKDISSGRLSASRFSPSTSMLSRPDSFGSAKIFTSNDNSSGADSIPVAIALKEQVESKFKGSHHESKIQGDVIISFALESVLSREPLPEFSFKIAGRSPEQIQVNKELVRTDGDTHTFITERLLARLKEEAKRPGARFFNLPIVRYTLTITCLPLTLIAYWKCEPDTTDFRLDYEYVGSALSKPLPLTDIEFKVPISGSLMTGSEQTNPAGTWNPDEKVMLWSLPEIKSGDEGRGSLKGRFFLQEGPGSPATVSVRYKSDGTILSGTGFDLLDNNYKVTLCKRTMHAISHVETDKLVTYV